MSLGRKIFFSFLFWVCNFVRDSILLFGVDVREWIRPPTKEEVGRTARSGLKQARNQYEDRMKSPPSPSTAQGFSSEMVGWLFSVIFPVTRMLLALRGCFVASKQEMADNASLLEDIPGWEVVPEAYREWKNWEGRIQNSERFSKLCRDMETYLANSFTKELAEN